MLVLIHNFESVIESEMKIVSKDSEEAVKRLTSFQIDHFKPRRKRKREKKRVLAWNMTEIDLTSKLYQLTSNRVFAGFFV